MFLHKTPVGVRQYVSSHAFYKDLVGCFGFNGPLRQYFRLYRAVSRRKMISERKND